MKNTTDKLIFSEACVIPCVLLPSLSAEVDVHVYSIPLTNRVRGPYRKLRTKFFPPQFMAQARSTRAINRRGKNEDP